MSILGALVNANSKAAGYSAAGRRAYNEGLKQKIQKYSEANAAVLQASKALSSAGENMMTARANQNMAVGSARAMQANSGFDSTSGTGGGMERNAQRVGDIAIANMAQSASEKAGNMYNSAYTARNAGNSAMRLGERTNEIYSKMAKASKTAGWIEAGIDTVLAIATGGASLSVTEKQNTQNENYNKTNNLNPGDTGYRERKNQWKQSFMTAMTNSDGADSTSYLLNYFGYTGGKK